MIMQWCYLNTFNTNPNSALEVSLSLFTWFLLICCFPSAHSVSVRISLRYSGKTRLSLTRESSSSAVYVNLWRSGALTALFASYQFYAALNSEFMIPCYFLLCLVLSHLLRTRLQWHVYSTVRKTFFLYQLSLVSSRRSWSGCERTLVSVFIKALEIFQHVLQSSSSVDSNRILSST